ncbi:MAG: hypothetical protein JRI22_09275, partial [Deltaproteobacteria bacterium]|nr:hypothetical protein [Deltaproteobacteria bacterium]
MEEKSNSCRPLHFPHDKIMISGRMLVIRRGGLGDFILALPVLEALHKRFEGLHLEVMCASSMIPLVM